MRSLAKQVTSVEGDNMKWFTALFLAITLCQGCGEEDCPEESSEDDYQVCLDACSGKEECTDGFCSACKDSCEPCRDGGVFSGSNANCYHQCEEIPFPEEEILEKYGECLRNCDACN